ncbi:MAG TPA: GNAT family N-acetyltransferase [Verrucomicrobiae bacterium]|nr:GNAT family N-acetyltransferase [Verrucomicrobiae bacterium]
MTWRMARRRDCRLLAELNQQLIADEGHRNPMTIPQLETRMRNWLEEGYDAVLFERDVEVTAYALYRVDSEEIYLRHFFVARHLRRQGIGREAMGLLRGSVWPSAPRLIVSVLTHNEAGLKFWRTMGFKDYCLTLEILR